MIGLVVGFLAAILIVLLDLYLWVRTSKTVTEHAIELVEKQAKKPVEIIEPPAPAQERFVELLEENDEKGIDTKFE
ncbi:MAG TPA: hypothetical protein VF974_04755 [Patescibacteria group bacterium]